MQELQDVLSFLHKKAKVKEVKDQIHAIWCVCCFLDLTQPTMCAGFVLLRTFIGIGMSNLARMVKSSRIKTFHHD